MTKRLFGVVKGHREHIADHTGRLYSDSEVADLLNTVSDSEVADLLNTVHEENEQLKTQLQNTSDQRDEFHRGARENANRVGKLKKENEQLKHSIKCLEADKMELQQYIKRMQGDVE